MYIFNVISQRCKSGVEERSGWDWVGIDDTSGHSLHSRTPQSPMHPSNGSTEYVPLCMFITLSICIWQGICICEKQIMESIQTVRKGCSFLGPIHWREDTQEGNLSPVEYQQPCCSSGHGIQRFLLCTRANFDGRCNTTSVKIWTWPARNDAGRNKEKKSSKDTKWA